jgi:hypothetical protein
MAEAGFVIGLQVPTAPEMMGPGTLTADGHRLEGIIRDRPASVHATSVDVPLVSSDSVAAQVAAVFPPEADTHWQALVPENLDYLSLIPNTSRMLLGGQGFLMYTLDFGGSDPCNGCTVKMTVCTAEDIPWLDMQLANQVLARETGLSLQKAKELTCVEPFPTTIIVDTLEPIGDVAWLSPEGGPVLNATHGPVVEMEYILGHSRPQWQEFTLEPVASERGWVYGWYDLADNPLTDINVPPDPCETNLQVISTGMPTCTVAYDTIHLTATSVTSPVLVATAVSHIHVTPDLNECPVADVGVAKVGSTDAISSGQSVSFTLTVSSHVGAPIGALLTDTLAPASAISNTILPAGCNRAGGEITCLLTIVATDTPEVLTFVVQVVEGFAGILSDEVEVQPVARTDPWFYDNYAGPVTVQVASVGGPHRIYLPIVLKNY